MPDLIVPTDPRYQLGVASMDETHQEFIELVNKSAKADKEQFILIFEQLVEHTKAHFSAENRLMEETGFHAILEHKNEHLRVLGELNRIGQKVAAGSILMGRAYVKEQLPGWFDLHAITMDSALAAHIRSSRVMPV
ncbi:MAG: hemerythrin domain-containing protein [Candidatus Thiodiazotropha sp.]